MNGYACTAHPGIHPTNATAIAPGRCDADVLEACVRPAAVSAKALDALRQGRIIMERLTKLSPENAVWTRDLAWFDGQIAELPAVTPREATRGLAPNVQPTGVNH
jgi:hypothetical protein